MYRAADVAGLTTIAKRGKGLTLIDVAAASSHIATGKLLNFKKQFIQTKWLKKREGKECKKKKKWIQIPVLIRMVLDIAPFCSS